MIQDTHFESFVMVKGKEERDSILNWHILTMD